MLHDSLPYIKLRSTLLWFPWGSSLSRVQEKQEIMFATGIDLKQLTNWFLNNRKRLWKPLVDAMEKDNASKEIMPKKRKTPSASPPLSDTEGSKRPR